MQRGHSGRGRNRKHNRPRRISGSGAKGTRCDLTNRLLSHRERKKTPLSKEWDANHEVSTGAACFRNARARACVCVCMTCTRDWTSRFYGIYLSVNKLDFANQFANDSALRKLCSEYRKVGSRRVSRMKFNKISPEIPSEGILPGSRDSSSRYRAIDLAAREEREPRRFRGYWITTLCPTAANDFHAEENRAGGVTPI